MLQRISYFSRATVSLDLPQLAAHAGAANAKLGVTGLLLSEGEFFLQVLEGPRPHVSELFLRIARDDRHRDVTLIEADTITEACYPNWSMGLFEHITKSVALWPSNELGKFDPRTMKASTLRDFIRNAAFELLQTQRTATAARV